MKRYKKLFVRIAGIIFIFIFLWLSLKNLQFYELWASAKDFFLNSPSFLLLVTVCYFLSFMLKAWAWKLYFDQNVYYRNCVKGVLYSLFINHISPLKIGDFIRAGYLAQKEKNISLDESLHSVVILRALDMLVLISFSLAGLLFFSQEIRIHVPLWIIWGGLIFLLSGIALLIFWKPVFIGKHLHLFRQALLSKKAIPILLLITVSWVLEGTVVWCVTRSIDNPISFVQSVWVNSLTVGGQIFQVTPGGITTYEAVMTMLLTAVNYPVKLAYHTALISHGYKFIFSYVVGLILLLQSPYKNYRQLQDLLNLRRDAK